MTKYSLLVFLLALNVSEAMLFPGLQLISDCMETKCGAQMKSCLKSSRSELTENARGCIIRDCKNVFKLCMKQIRDRAFSYGEGMVEKKIADFGLDVLTDSYLQCWINTDNGTQHSDCFVDESLSQMSPFITLVGSTLFSDPAYMACWIANSLKAFVFLLDSLHTETDYMDKLKMYKNIEALRNPYEYVRCYQMGKVDDDCAHVWNRILGNPSMRRQTKDFSVAVIQDLISVTRKCQRS